MEELGVDEKISRYVGSREWGCNLDSASSWENPAAGSCEDGNGLFLTEESPLSLWLVKQYATESKKEIATKTEKINVGTESLPLNLLMVTDIQYWADWGTAKLRLTVPIRTASWAHEPKKTEAAVKQWCIFLSAKPRISLSELLRNRSLASDTVQESSFVRCCFSFVLLHGTSRRHWMAGTWNEILRPKLDKSYLLWTRNKVYELDLFIGLYISHVLTPLFSRTVDVTTSSSRLHEFLWAFTQNLDRPSRLLRVCETFGSNSTADTGYFDFGFRDIPQPLHKTMR